MRAENNESKKLSFQWIINFLKDPMKVLQNNKTESEFVGLERF